MRSALISATAALLLLASPARSMTLDDVRRSLAAMPGASALKVRIETQQRKQSGKEKTENTTTFSAEDDGTSLRVVHAKADLRRSLEKEKEDLRGLEPAEVLELMNYAPALGRLLQGATLTKTAQSAMDGAPATLFEVTPVREKSERGEKFVKNYADTLRIWVGAAGIPVAAERTSQIKAGMLMLNFDTKLHETLHFTRAADHLVVTKHTTELALTGMGQNEAGMKTATVTVLGN